MKTSTLSENLANGGVGTEGDEKGMTFDRLESRRGVGGGGVAIATCYSLIQKLV